MCWWLIFSRCVEPNFDRWTQESVIPNDLSVTLCVVCKNQPAKIPPDSSRYVWRLLQKCKLKTSKSMTCLRGVGIISDRNEGHGV